MSQGEGKMRRDAGHELEIAFGEPFRRSIRFQVNDSTHFAANKKRSGNHRSPAPRFLTRPGGIADVGIVPKETFSFPEYLIDDRFLYFDRTAEALATAPSQFHALGTLDADDPAALRG